MVKLNKIYTRTGDRGSTGLGDGSRRSKDDLRVEAYGAVDEVNSSIGVARLSCSHRVDELLDRVQQDLFDVGADLCCPPDQSQTRLRVVEEQIESLEGAIDELNHNLSPLNSFVLPGGAAASAHLHIARAVARRAERRTVALSKVEEINEITVKYLNRLSDLLFVMARFENKLGSGDVLWVPGVNRNAR
ncbi:cob(I)yrinic acid a,c-diamide adenosyltransferase [Bosea sp. 685]|uniref:cob(I)yrinic acid a,c-diamide adenosyltransferase n=1 Tax=Bosea sp. 685 TaxID=3080057 RepID=UPI0028935633|nr:cob(I)yrinic acid a,c-diamide adenosyltransferase [Bosea sp. 685]WNJ89610.1 cob(I)yrinic acid a,c-diamide adenosyltransferase [Bosea sp. 685]